MARTRALRPSVQAGEIDAPNPQPPVAVTFSRATKLFSATYMKRHFNDSSYEGLVVKVRAHFSDEAIRWSPVIRVEWTNDVTVESWDEEDLPQGSEKVEELFRGVSRSTNLHVSREYIGRREGKTYVCPWAWTAKGDPGPRTALVHGSQALQDKARAARSEVYRLPFHARDEQVSNREMVLLPYTWDEWFLARTLLTGEDAFRRLLDRYHPANWVASGFTLSDL